LRVTTSRSVAARGWTGAAAGPPGGFTLVEMMVVITIILLLAAMLFPALEAALGKSESTSCLANMRHLGTAARLYSDDYDGLIIPAMLPHPHLPRGVCWTVSIQPYLNNTEILLCPSDEHPRRLPGALSELHSYGINLALAEVGGYMGSSLQVVSIEDPAATILLCELNGARFCTHGVNYEAGGLERVAGHRHGNGSNYSFVDGHAKWLPPEATAEPESLWDP